MATTPNDVSSGGAGLEKSDLTKSTPVLTENQKQQQSIDQTSMDVSSKPNATPAPDSSIVAPS